MNTSFNINDVIDIDHITKFDVDPLAISCANIRNFDRPGLNESVEVTADDVLLAENIRNYYLKKYVWNKLNDSPYQSEYKDNAIRLLSIEKEWNLTDRDCGLFVKLPFFYKEDIVYDQFRKTLITDYSEYQHAELVEETLTFLEKTTRWQGSKKRVSFWFKSPDNKLWSVTVDPLVNPFVSLFEETLTEPRTYKMSVSPKNIYGMCYNAINTIKS